MSSTPPRNSLPRHISSPSADTSRLAESSRPHYFESLVAPDKNEFNRIAEIQVKREVEDHRRTRSSQRDRRPMEQSRPHVGNLSANPQGAHKSRGSLSDRLGLHFSRSRGSVSGDASRDKAARLIQRTYRGYRTRREMKGLGMDASTRWTQALREAQFRAVTRPRARTIRSGDGPDRQEEDAGEPSPEIKSENARAKWKKASIIARRAGGDMDVDDSDSSTSSTSSSSSSSSTARRNAEQKKVAKKLREEAKAQRQKDSMMLGLQYFLEMVDLKHRYGSNLRTYHEEWKKSDTKENFFYWLDYGEGKDVEMAACPRERLEREQVRYLSREERQYYLVKVDEDGRLCWDKNGVRIDTSEQWKDSIHGIVPADDPTPAFQPTTGSNTPMPGDTSAQSSEASASESELEAARAAKYMTPGLDEAKGAKKISHLSASTIMNKLLRKSVRKNTWIFVADTSFRLYVGIKNSGAFQHSSFLQGARISSAGLIKIKNGRLASLSPLSGHYRPPASNFRAFVKSLKEEGVDMSHVSVSKSYAVLVGLEAYVKTRRKGKDMMGRITHRKNKIVAPEEVRQREEANRDKSESAEKERKVLEEQRVREEKEREENAIGVKVMQKLGIMPQEPGGQKGGGDGEESSATASKSSAAKEGADVDAVAAR